MSKSVELYKINKKLDILLYSQGCILDLLSKLVASNIDQNVLKELSVKIQDDTNRLKAVVDQNQS